MRKIKHNYNTVNIQSIQMCDVKSMIRCKLSLNLQSCHIQTRLKKYHDKVQFIHTKTDR